MSPTNLTVTGLPDGLWSDITLALDNALACPLHTLDPRGPGTILAIVERAPRALARAFSKDPSLDVEAWQMAWTAASRHLLRLVLMHRERFVVVELEDLQRRPQAVASRLGEATGALYSWQLPPPPPSPDPLLLAAAEAAWAATSAEDPRLHGELLACCELFAGAEDLSVRNDEPPPVASAALAAWGALQRGLAEERATRRGLEDARLSDAEALEQLQTQLDTLEGERRTISARHLASETQRRDAEVQLRQLTDEAARLRDAVARTSADLETERRRSQTLERKLVDERQARATNERALGDESTTLRESLSRANGELKGAQQRIHELGLQVAAAEQSGKACMAESARVQQELDAALRHTRELGAQLAEGERLAVKNAAQTKQAQQDHQAALQRARELDARLAELEAAVAARTADADQFGQESELALLQLAAATDALESSQSELKQLRQEMRERAEAVRPGEVAVQEARLVHARDERPYRELTFALRGVRFGESTPRQGQVRLVEHHGRPGVAVFGAADGTNLLSSWRETGREGDRLYMLIIPGDPSSIALLEALDTPDWLTLLALGNRFEAVLQEAPAPQRATWLPLAQRLRQQLEGVPARLRTAGVRIEKARDDNGDVELVLEHVSWASYRLPRVELVWSTASGRVALRTGRDGRPPLASWPDVNDQPLETMSLPVGPDRGLAGSAPWSVLPEIDRRFVAALLGAMPRIVDGLLASSALPADRGTRLRPLAASLSVEAFERLEPLALREFLPRLVRRLTRRLLGQR
jgi:predicted  nucleic acid-binding Zn-ribbon protein